MLTSEEKIKATEDNKANETDTGSNAVQAALLSGEIKKLSLHLKKHAKDFSSKRGLLKMVAKRRKFLNAIKNEDPKKYNALVKEMGLEK